jgi:hypothetical protein
MSIRDVKDSFSPYLDKAREVAKDLFKKIRQLPAQLFGGKETDEAIKNINKNMSSSNQNVDDINISSDTSGDKEKIREKINQLNSEYSPEALEIKKSAEIDVKQTGLDIIDVIESIFYILIQIQNNYSPEETREIYIKEEDKINIIMKYRTEFETMSNMHSSEGDSANSSNRLSVEYKEKLSDVLKLITEIKEAFAKYLD